MFSRKSEDEDELKYIRIRMAAAVVFTGCSSHFYLVQQPAEMAPAAK